MPRNDAQRKDPLPALPAKSANRVLNTRRLQLHQPHPALVLSLSDMQQINNDEQSNPQKPQMIATNVTTVIPGTISKQIDTAQRKPRDYGFLLMLAAMALIVWLLDRFFNWGRTTKPVLSKKAERLQNEINTLEILQEQARLDLRRVRIEQKTLQTEEAIESGPVVIPGVAAHSATLTDGHIARPQ
ncbi:MAG: hypothetical protein IPK53_04100 [bacterium]|nr:hypothetical protein [bacterium]